VSDGPLSGIRILELGTLIAGPFAARLLSDLGAGGSKGEAPGRGDPMRDWGAVRHEGRSLWWPVQTRSKRLITLNLREARGQALCRDLVRHVDVLIENFRPGTMERWNLGPADLEPVNPRLIYARVSGFGQTGPYAPRGGFAAAGEAMSGLRHLNGFPDQPPPRTGLSLGDSLSGMFAVIGILTALLERKDSETGQTVDASILESCFAMLESVAPEYHRAGVVRGPQGTGLVNNAPSNIYRSRDDKWMVIAANNDNLWPRLCGAMAREDLAEDERFATHDGRTAHEDELDALIGRWAQEHDAAEIEAILVDAGVVVAPVNTIADLFEDPHARERELLVAVEDDELGDVLGPAVVPKLSRTPGRQRFTSTWTAGEANDDVFGDLLGIDADEREQLAAEGIM
jgi:crotonobetainyl-CoA:carnitine CoA-transferase CaiB-like acyl-CoA transferase